ncbi:unnamed protein product [Callosobruchus maculatus]|uniref:UDP-glucuronosyltransferase n=1 Tax=Callosobruchus maculatus TaxID=64391 RepID=A0A653CXC4_CALMS|nr:unnamed protein product [Callosobruchus maculatus]
MRNIEMKMLLIHIFTLISISSGARILGVIPTPSFSHQTVFWPIWKELSLRGHNVTVITTDPMNNPYLRNLTEINIQESYTIWRPLYESVKSANNPILINERLQSIFQTISKFVLTHTEVAALLQNETVFDLVMVEAQYPELLIFGEIYECPTVMLRSLDAFSETHEAMGNSIHPIMNPDLNVPHFRELDFKARLISTTYYWYQQLLGFPRYMSKRNKIIREYFGNDAPDIRQMLDKVSLLFLNIHPALHGVRLTGPNTIQFGGSVHIRDPQPLPKDLKTYLDTAAEGVVYFSLGSNVLSANLKASQFDAIIQALGELPYKVLWKYELDDIPHKPQNIKFFKWFPQQDVLRHPNIRAFVTQGGLQSLEEAIYCHVPVVVLPFATDQQQNAKKVEYKQIGKVIYHKSSGINKVELKNAIIEVIENTSYRENMKILAELLTDEPMSGVEKVIWWTEYVIRHKGAKHLRNPSLDVPFYQYFMLDIIAFWTVTFILLLLLVVVACQITNPFLSSAIGCMKCKKE